MKNSYPYETFTQSSFETEVQGQMKIALCTNVHARL